jgi:hypothetical protein
MNLNRAYGLSYTPKKGVIVRVSERAYDWLFNVSDCQTLKANLRQEDLDGFHYFILPIENHARLAPSVKDFADVLKHLSRTPVTYRQSDPQLIELEIGSVGETYVLSGGMHNSLRHWCLRNLSQVGPISTRIREICGSAWDMMNPYPIPSKAESFYCDSEGEMIRLGRRGGGIGAVIKPGDHHAEIVATNAETATAVALITTQLALIEKAYRVWLNQKSQHPKD